MGPNSRDGDHPQARGLDYVCDFPCSDDVGHWVGIPVGSTRQFTSRINSGQRWGAPLFSCRFFLDTMLNLVGDNYALLSVAAACGLYTLYRKYSRISISDVPGPESKTFLLGTSIASPRPGFLVDMITQATARSYFSMTVGQPKPSSVNVMGMSSASKPP